MEFGEKSFREAALREIYEEYRIKPRGLKLCGVTNVIRKNGKRKTHWVCFIFSACVNPEKARVGEPHKMEELRLFPTKKLPKPLHSMLKKHLAVVRRAGVKI
jgi:ADP-ribose pyrophosphatase YjhB (NUDIX family)